MLTMMVHQRMRISRLISFRVGSALARLFFLSDPWQQHRRHTKRSQIQATQQALAYLIAKEALKKWQEKLPA